MQKKITTIYLPIELIDYIRINKVNLSQFVTTALYEHSGSKTGVDVTELQEKVNKLKVDLAVNQAILDDKLGDLEQKKKDLKNDKEELDIENRRCKNCGGFVSVEDAERDSENYRYGYCQDCWLKLGYCKEALNAKKH